MGYDCLYILFIFLDFRLRFIIESILIDYDAMTNSLYKL